MSKGSYFERPAHLKRCQKVKIWIIRTGLKKPSQRAVNKKLQFMDDTEVIHLYWTGKRFISEKLCLYYMRGTVKKEREATAQAEIDAKKATVDDVLRFVQSDRRNRQGVTQ